MYAIENGIRELIIDRLAKIDGPLWYKHRLPGDVLKKYREAIEAQRSTKWTTLTPHHPIYYLDFPDLKKIIERQDNWKDAFSTIFARKEWISAVLTELEPTRNSLAHNRKLAKEDITMLESAWLKLASAIGEETLGRLSSLTSQASTIREVLNDLRSELEASLHACTKCQKLESMEVWKLITQQWWFDQTYLGRPIAPLQQCFELFIEYSNLPRHRGSGHSLEKWLKNSRLVEAASSALESLQELLDSAD